MISLSKKLVLNKSKQIRLSRYFQISRNILQFIHKDFSIYEATFVNSVESQLSKNKSSKIFEVDRKDFEIKLLDDPLDYFSELKNGIQDLRRNENQENLKICLEYILVVMKYFLLYENSKFIFNLYIEVVEELLNISSNIKSPLFFKEQFKKFISEDLKKLDNNENIFVLYFLYSFLKRQVKSMWPLVLLDEFLLNNSKEIESYRQYLLKKPEFNCEKTDDLLELVLNVIPNIFKDISVVSKKSYNENYRITYEISKHVISFPLTQGIFIDLMVIYQTYINTKGINHHNYENLLIPLDTVISEYFISSECPNEILFYCGNILAHVKNITRKIVILPYIFTN
jgi:hypothetical protein